MSSVWSQDLAGYWKNYVPPCRPSRFDLEICSEVIEAVRRRLNHRPKVLILGSTNEFRDWAFEERCETTVVDNSLVFHRAISEDRRYKTSKEDVRIVDWLNLDIQNEFDLVVGDLVIGNIWSPDIPRFLEIVYGMLVAGGSFITKSFFYNANSETPSLVELAHRFSDRCGERDPFPYFAYALTVRCRNPLTGILNFADMHGEIEKFVRKGTIPEWVQRRYEELGWSSGSKISFEVLETSAWEDQVLKLFDSINKSIGPYYWSADFPVYTCIKK